MSRWIYRKPEPTHERGLCVICHKGKQKRKSIGKYSPLCSWCETKRYGLKKKWYPKAYQRKKLKICERCGFIPEHACQLDMHHLDGDHHNNDPNNLQTLCSNCHRLVHYILRRPLET